MQSEGIFWSNGEILKLNINKEYFLTEIFEKNIYLFKKSINTKIYDWNDLSRDFYSLDPSQANVKIFQGERIDRGEFISCQEELGSLNYRYDQKKIRELLLNGSSLVIDRFEKTSLYINKINQQLRSYIDNIVVGNAYITKGGKGTFGLHWDTHCVFAAQIKGRKRWKIFAPTMELPLHHQTSIFEKKAARLPTKVIFDEDLEEGDILYIPRGWWHDATPIDGVKSFHIAYGVHTIKVHDYLKWILIRRMADNLTFKASVNPRENKNINLALATNSLKEVAENPENFKSYVDECLSLLQSKTEVDFHEVME